MPLVRRLLDGERVTARRHLVPVPGRDLRAAAGPAAPADPHRRHGAAKGLPIVARHADLWNAYGSPAELAASDAILRAACDAVGRDEREIERTFNGNVVIRDSRDEAVRAWTGWLETHRPQSGEDRLNAFGTVEEVAEQLDGYRAAGFDHAVLIFRSPFDLETMDRLPALRAALGD